MTADQVATRAILTKECHEEVFVVPSGSPTLVQAFFDGGRRDGISGCGWHIEACWGESEEWQTILEASAYLGEKSSVEAELEGACQAIRSLLDLAQVWRARA